MAGINFATAKSTVAKPFIARYSDWSEYLADVRKPWIVPNHSTMAYASHKVSQTDTDFRGTANWSEADELADTGWLEGAKRIESICNGFEAQITSMIESQEMYLDVSTPYAWDMGAFVTGHPECGINFTTVHTEGTSNKIVRILFYGNASAAISNENMILKGAMVAALARMLELAGNRVEITLAYCSYSDKNRDHKTAKSVAALIPIKRADQPIDLTLLAFQIAHPSVFRRVFFKWLENFNRGMQQLNIYRNYGYGGEMKSQHDGYDVIIPSSFILETDGGKDWILAQMRKHGVTLNTGD